MKNIPDEKEINRDPFIQRAIEHWLDSVNELGYQPLFCEWLINQGYALKYSIKNTNFEQGKDVVAVSSTGEAHGYQLKGGSIDLKRWRSEVKPEIEALIEIPIQHPDIDKNKSHISYLVTNGEIEDAARADILGLNEGKWKKTPLKIWTRGDLLSGFQSMAEGILPKDAQTYKELIDLIFSDGTGLPDISRINAFLSQILQIDNSTVGKAQRRRDIAGAILYSAMIAGPYRKQENHGSVVRIMVLLLSLIFYIVDKYNLEDKYWLEFYEVIWNDIIETTKLLEAEVNSGAFDTSFTSPFDTDLIPFRKHSASSIIYALKAAQLIEKNDAWKSMLDMNVVKKYQGTIALWGEASFIPMILISCIIKSIPDGEVTAPNLIQTAISRILEFNGRKSKQPIGLAPLYKDIEFAVQASFNLIEKDDEEKHKLSSHLLKPLVEIMARLGKREFIEQNWQEISYMRFEEFVPDDNTDYWLWRVSKGENRSILPKKQQSWKELVEVTQKIEGKNLPLTMNRFPAFLPFFLVVFPHRTNSETMGMLYKVCK